MKITKYVHSCLLVEMPDPVNRTVLFDPGGMSEQALDVSKLAFLDDIVITHSHGDHLSIKLMKQLVEKFPEVRILSTAEVVSMLAEQGITATTTPAEGLELFESPHEDVSPLFPVPPEIGVHYLDVFTDPGDSHHFASSKQILALPVTAPWGSLINAARLALDLKPQYIIPIHDWHWSDAARTGAYDMLEGVFKEQGITFLKPETGVPMVINT